MYLFWNSVIRPLLDCVKPDAIVEIGADYGTNTVNLLEYVQQFGGVVHVIDPLPKFSVDDWEGKYGKSLVVHEVRSLDALPTIHQMDVVLIDGDHNWYTVYNELKLIEEYARRHDAQFPLVLLHDIGWPYGRRDLYYDPQSIPSEYRKPYKLKGMSPGRETLQDDGGLNSHLYNAAYENGPRNGVLTAVEDFMEESSACYELVQIPANFGLGILLPKEMAQSNHEIAQWLTSINGAKKWWEILEMTEQERVRRQIEAAETKWSIHEKVAVIDDLREEVSCLQVETEQEKHRLVEKEKLIKDLKNKWSYARSQSEEYKSRLEDSRIMHKRIADKAAAVRASWRWRIGDLIVRAVEVLMRRERQALALDEIEDVASEYSRLDDPVEAEGVDIGPVEHGQSGDTLPDSMAKCRRPAGRHRRVDIVIPVFNALSSTGQCLLSLMECTTAPYRMVIVNDASDSETSHWLRWFANRFEPRVVLLENEVNQGYTRSINRGIRSAQSPYVVLLNSDTVVTPGWLDRLCECAESDPAIGIVGPLSNAASWQNVPELLGADGGFAINELPRGWTPADMAAIVEHSVPDPAYPRVPFVNGFCYLIKSEVIDAIGLFDEVTFPEGFGEENDYSLRCAKAGFDLAIADNCYVFHSKSRSFGHERRKELSQSGKLGLESKHNVADIRKMVSEIKNNREIQGIRKRILSAVSRVKDNTSSMSGAETGLGRIVFLLPVRGGGGGAHSVVQEASAMRSMGFDAVVAVREKMRGIFLDHYERLTNVNELFVSLTNSNLLDVTRNASVVIATMFHSVELLARVTAAYPHVLPAYYVQDYEAWFFEQESPKYHEALNSYNAIPGVVRFAKTSWLCEEVDRWHGGVTHRVIASIDRAVYHPAYDKSVTGGPLSVTAMVRPRTPRRGAPRTMKLLRTLAERHGGNIDIEVFGCSDKDITDYKLDKDFEFINHGEIKQSDVAQNLARADIFLDLSDYQAFGRTAIEAMACGCVPVVTRVGGADEFVEDGRNGYLIDVNDTTHLLKLLDGIIADRGMLQSMREVAIATASRYSTVSAALSELVMLQGARYVRSPETERRHIAVHPVRQDESIPTSLGYARME